ncbi:HD domain-containing protein [Paenibacillus abyssi]|uniref:Phosphohydrolase n=1 Tax=Paenibacillus abyssi TaxID=1340531 RepID=A0A917FX73_9BACL|nr:HD domain-containing protein [Paenibacillus abyssi]GGG13392.1 phosphohydrolase [Paenibacillus abyssi]
MPDRIKTLELARSYVKSRMEHDSSGHDWWHIVRVTRTAKLLAEVEQADVYICELAALLHDIADEKLNESKEAGLRKVADWLESAGLEASDQTHIMEIISTMSFGGGNKQPMATREGQIVQDADRLDAIGAIGIARTFAYSGWKGQLIYDPGLQPRNQLSKEQYRNGQTTAINHFYEKLLKLKALMNTETARLLAEERHQFMELFLKTFDQELETGQTPHIY